VVSLEEDCKDLYARLSKIEELSFRRWDIRQGWIPLII
jgi:hypothetical protein